MKRVAAIIPSMSKVVTNHLDYFQEQIDTALKTFEERMSRLQKLQVHHLLRTNDREQRSRGWSVRIHNYHELTENHTDKKTESDEPAAVQNPDTTDKRMEPGPTADQTNEGENPEAAREKSRPSLVVRIWSRIIEPALKLAHSAGELNWIPSMHEAIEMAHPLPSRQGYPPAVIFRFVRRPTMFWFLRHKFEPIKAFNAANDKLKDSRSAADKVKYGSLLPCRVGADLTDLNRRLLTWLHGQEEISYSKISGNKIIYQRKDVPGRWFSLMNPFACNLDDMARPPADVNGFLLDSLSPTPPFLQGKAVNSPTATTRRLNFEDSIEGSSSPNLQQRSTYKPLKRSKLTKALQQMKSQFEREVLTLSEDLDAIKEGQEMMVDTAEVFVSEISNVLADANILTECTDSESDSEPEVITDKAPAPPKQVRQVNIPTPEAPAPILDQDRSVQTTPVKAGQQVRNDVSTPEAPAPILDQDRSAAAASLPLFDGNMQTAPAPLEQEVATVDGGTKRDNAHLTPILQEDDDAERIDRIYNGNKKNKGSSKKKRGMKARN
ncbi:MAG: hypothetical protein GY696_32050 [Gammaproteobacteria bacterium]|nr:hypothetical protein [Gammaproteobacteria bacterium]